MKKLPVPVLGEHAAGESRAADLDCAAAERLDYPPSIIKRRGNEPGNELQGAATCRLHQPGIGYGGAVGAALNSEHASAGNHGLLIDHIDRAHSDGTETGDEVVHVHKSVATASGDVGAVRRQSNRPATRQRHGGWR